MSASDNPQYGQRREERESATGGPPASIHPLDAAKAKFIEGVLPLAFIALLLIGIPVAVILWRTALGG